MGLSESSTGRVEMWGYKTDEMDHFPKSFGIPSHNCLEQLLLGIMVFLMVDSISTVDNWSLSHPFTSHLTLHSTSLETGGGFLL